jgi:CRISPR/Cas system-associated exonuclease Cas4 (RecB family)
MMGTQKARGSSNVLSASEIGQYLFCSVAWKLRRCGYEPESPFLEPGKNVHVALGNRIDGLETRLRYARWYAMIGVLVLLVAFLLLLFGVMV